MVSVAFAIRPSPSRPDARQKCPMFMPGILCSKRRASLAGALAPIWLQYCMAARRVEARVWNDVDDVSGVSEPHGSDGAVADRGRIGAPIPQPGTARHFRPAVRPARRRTRI